MKTSGYDFSIPYLPPAEAKVVQRTFGMWHKTKKQKNKKKEYRTKKLNIIAASNYFLLPNPDYYGDQVFVSTATQNYTANDYQALLTALGIPVCLSLLVILLFFC